MSEQPSHYETALAFLDNAPYRAEVSDSAAGLAIASAQVHATLAVAEQLARIADLLADLPTRLNP